MTSPVPRTTGATVFLFAALLACLAYWPGLSGGWFFDDFSSIVDNAGVQPRELGWAQLRDAALSSPASDLKRPLASLSFLANFLLGGMAPFGWKLANLAIHLLNGWLLFLLVRTLGRAAATTATTTAADDTRNDVVAALVAAAWLLLPINLTAVLFVVQRMESLANLFVFGGLLLYLGARARMLADAGGFGRCAAALILCTGIGVLAKETAVMLPLYALLTEWALLRFRGRGGRVDRRLVLLFALILLLPAVVGLAVLLPWLLDPSTWASRPFTLQTRLLSEARIVVDYIGWNLLPLPQSLSFYHDHFRTSSGLLSPWSTLASLLVIAALLLAAVALRRRRPLAALGIALYFAGHALTATVLPLELIYEHRNYFPSAALLLALVPWLAAGQEPAPTLRRALLGLLLLWWSGLTWHTAVAWGNPLALATELAARAPDSARAQFGLGRELVQASRLAADSPLLQQGFAVLERAATMPDSSILPEQTLLVNHSLLGRPLLPRWWQQLDAKLALRAADAEDVSAMGALARCARDRHCALPNEDMRRMFDAALTRAPADARILVIYSDWAWNVLDDKPKALELTQAAAAAQPRDPAHRIALVRMNIVLGRPDQAREQLQQLRQLDRSGELQATIRDLGRYIEPEAR